MRIVLIPGMGCSPVARVNWYSWFANEVLKKQNVDECVLRDFPDPNGCKESIWIPFLRDEIGLDENTIVVGHSSGAACAMRLLENDEVCKLKGVLLVAAAYTDLGDEYERRSEYFSRPWNWEKMKKGAEKIHCFHGVDDHLIPVKEARYIAVKMKGPTFKYSEIKGGVSHFFEPWDEILDVIDDMLCS
ncbi:alpha/beta-hydrolase [Chaetoceros tenuissimus]|uniref:Alpha/beta-hydrolase n=1 Tax=Chaetoceros tenuissimus TaxID=426638 RepID=A0AAD3HDI5_9STRA|nr:alpha/beta-hydrolase [Chaetoceros tenuissimus]